MGIARNGEIQKLKLMASVLKRNNPTPGLLKTREMGEAASCANVARGWPAEMGEAASCANSARGWPGKVRKRGFARLQQSWSHARTGNSAGNQRFIQNGSS